MEWKPRLVLSSVRSAIREDEIQSVKMTPYKHSRGGRMIQTYNKVKIYDHKKEHLVGGLFFFSMNKYRICFKTKRKSKIYLWKEAAQGSPSVKTRIQTRSAVLLKKKSEGCWDVREKLSVIQSFREDWPSGFAWNPELVTVTTVHKEFRDPREFTEQHKQGPGWRNRCCAGRCWGVFAHREEKKHWGLCFIQNTGFFLKNCKAINNKLHERTY